MTKDELFELLELDTPEDFMYFEQFADLVECSDEIEYDNFYLALSLADSKTLAEINENYFSEIEKNFPKNCDDALEIIENVWNSLKLLCEDLDDEQSRTSYIQQLFKFHEWYVAPEKVLVDQESCSVLDALAEYRSSKLENTEHEYDFDNALDYEFDDISIRIGGYAFDESYSSVQNN